MPLVEQPECAISSREAKPAQELLKKCKQAYLQTCFSFTAENSKFQTERSVFMHT